ncbi:hypothetical protein ABEX47_07020 [Paenibacillus ehimensis]|uniref:hypothetical protein n=1 Tax=Paenibacillus ehimensis TaxID=79264 RepID=UPI0013E3815E|nr:hypothetical protein [Paenibacillus ehimensis]
MARMGRPPKAEGEKKERESIYFDKDIIEWLREKAAKEDRTVSVELNRILRRLKEQEG